MWISIKINDIFFLECGGGGGGGAHNKDHNILQVWNGFVGSTGI